MPATRTPARASRARRHSEAVGGSVSSEAQPTSTQSFTHTISARPSAKRRSDNAFILFRSFMLKNGLCPPELINQAEKSRYIGGVWRSLSKHEQNVFFEMAEEEKVKFESEKALGIVHQRKPKNKRARSSNNDDSDFQSWFMQFFTAEPYSSVFPEPPSAFNLGESASNVISAAVSEPLPVAFSQSVQCSDAPDLLPAPQPLLPIPISLLEWGFETPSDAPE